MKQKFFTNTIQSSFIKNILLNTPLPIYNTIRVGDYILKDNLYIFKNNIIKCTKSGYVGPNIYEAYKNLATQELDDIVNEYDAKLLTSQIYNIEEIIAEFITIKNYEFGEDTPKYTDKFSSYYDFYDTDTHERLGKYLRCYRDIFDIDLMPFYNCFSGRYQEGVVIKDDGVYTLLHSSSYKIFKVPIKFNTEYTIAIDSGEDVFLAPVIMRGNDQLIVTDENNDEKDLTTLLVKNRIERYNSTSFKNPIIYKTDIINDDNEKLFNRYEKNLYLLIQVSTLNDSTLTILEGNYKYTDTSKIFNLEDINDISDKNINNLLLSNLSLLQFNNQTNYPFSNRIIEYLLLNVITNNDEISSNIKRVQEYLGYDTLANYYPGVFTNDLRQFIYQYVMSNRLTWKIDINGFVDKEAEKLILRGKSI